uniref:Cyclin N-terminal domain-containing protein n=1 Tax=Zea mays TaxID=4577 RepID=A0A804NM46_MAIZE
MAAPDVLRAAPAPTRDAQARLHRRRHALLAPAGPTSSGPPTRAPCSSSSALRISAPNLAPRPPHFTQPISAPCGVFCGSRSRGWGDDGGGGAAYDFCAPRLYAPAPNPAPPLCSLCRADADQQPWMPQLLSVACLTITAKMEETVVLRRLDIHQNQVPSEKYNFDLDAIQRMEIYVLDSLNWRMEVVTPFSYINYFVDKFTGGKPLSCGFISRCTGSLEATKLLQFRPFEMAAVVLSAAAESQVIAFSVALLASNIPFNKV